MYNNSEKITENITDEALQDLASETVVTILRDNFGSDNGKDTTYEALDEFSPEEIAAVIKKSTDPDMSVFPDFYEMANDMFEDLLTFVDFYFNVTIIQY